jgi:colanic acid/amylovoran biosynthesis glycosyltransferase
MSSDNHSPTTSPFDELVVLPSLLAQRGPKGGLILTQKYINGVAEYAKYWPGRVSTLVRVNNSTSSDLDHVEVMPGQLPFELAQRPESEEALAQRLRSAAVVLAFLSVQEAPTAALCKRLGVPLVYISEYSLKTEKQILDAEVANPITRLRRKWWIMRMDKKRRAALAIAAGIQCSGAPTYDIYRHVNPNAMIFFDSRVPLARVIDDQHLARKAAALREGRPLRLVFGGRLIKMKGAQDLPYVALELKRLKVPFQLDIYGGGVLEPALKRDIERLGLRDCVRLKGTVDFETQWVPLLKEQVDLFICCHPQGDPSSTYPEVMACGVPIAGYDNEAFKRVVDYAGSGWTSPIGQPTKLSAIVARLERQREDIVAAALKARQFACDHAFEVTFQARVDHLVRLSRLPAVLKAPRVPQDA